MNSKEINKFVLAVLFCFFTLNTALPQVAINTDGAQPNSSSILDVSSTTKGLLIPCMTEAQRNAITVTSTEKGLLVFQTDGTMGFYFYSGSSWVAIFNSLTSGVGGTGTSNYIPYWTASNNIGNSGLYWSGTNLGIGTTTPNNKLQIGSTTYSVNSLAMGNGTQNFAIDISARTIPTFFSDNNFSFMGSGGSGNVGIGTVTPLTTLQLGAVGSIGQDANSIYFGTNFSSTGVNFLKTGNYASQMHFDGATNNIVFKSTSSTGTAGSPITWVERMRINGSNGNVGIGTTDPTDLLQVGNLMIGGNSGREIYSTSGYDINYKATGGSAHHFYTNGTEKLNIQSNGNVGIGTTTPSYLLSLNGGAYCNGTTWTNASDIRLKRDIQPMSKYGLNTVMQLNPVTYFYKADTTNHPEVGFIAQDMQNIVPEVVSGTEGDISKGETLGLSYGNLVPVLTKAIQEQQSEIEELKTKNRDYETRLSKLEHNNQTADNASFGGNISTTVIVLIIGIGVALFYYRKTNNKLNNKHLQ